MTYHPAPRTPHGSEAVYCPECHVVSDTIAAIGPETVDFDGWPIDAAEPFICPACGAENAAEDWPTWQQIAEP